MFNENFFKKLSSYYKSYSTERYNLINVSGQLLRNSKQAIFALHRNEVDKAKELLNEIEVKVKDLLIKGKEEKELGLALKKEGSFKAALEEYLEAKFYLCFFTKEEIDFVVDFNEEYYDIYLGAISDVTGELVRKSINDVIKGEYSQIEFFKEVTEHVVEELIKFDLTGKLRSKYDDSRRNLKKIEGILYDLRLRNIK